jgi:hypothetical protein
MLTIYVSANTYYVSPNGQDVFDGSIIHPFLSLQKAQSMVQAGDTVLIRGGQYTMKESQIMAYDGIKAYMILLNKSGAKGKYIHYLAYPSEHPIFDFTTIKVPNYRIHAFEILGDWLHIKGIEVVGVQVTITNVNTQSICFSNDGGSYNIFEQLSMHDGQAIGFFLTKGAHNLILNCDAYRNNDTTSRAGGGRNGGNVDGFGNHPQKGSVDNVFRGCRAWLNSDDGFDCINAQEATVFENCWAFYNGFDAGFKSRGDGNGFKAGGYGAGPVRNLPNPIPRNKILHCIAVMNKANGFYANHHLGGSDWIGNTAYKNGINFNMTNRQSGTEMATLIDVPGYNHVLDSNISFQPKNAGNDYKMIDLNNCAWLHNLSSDSFTIKDFISLDMNLLTAPRDTNGNLVQLGFLRPYNLLIK